MKRFASVLLALCLCLTLTGPTLAHSGTLIIDFMDVLNENETASLYDDATELCTGHGIDIALVIEAGYEFEPEQLFRLSDFAGLLSVAESEKLLAQLDEVSENQKCDVVVITIDSLEGYTAQEFADDAFDYFGYGVKKDGVILLISVEDRDWAISTHGFGIRAVTDRGQEYIMDKILPDLGDDNYFKALSAFAALSDDFLTQARTGDPFDGHLRKTAGYIALIIGFALAFALIITWIIMRLMKAKLKSVHSQALAHEYIRKGSFRVTGNREMFLYSHVDRYEKARDTNDGGSSTHNSSSGETHGGSSGKF